MFDCFKSLSFKNWETLSNYVCHQLKPIKKRNKLYHKLFSNNGYGHAEHRF